MTASGIVLAGGRSSRFAPGMSGASKLDADLGGESVLERTIAAVSAVVDEVVVVGRSGPPGRDAPLAHGAVRFVADREPFGGPLAGLVAGLEACRGDIALVVGGDMPLLRPDVLRLQLDRLGNHDHEAALLLVGGNWQPLPLALQRSAALGAATASLEAGDRSLLGFVPRLAIAEVPEPLWRAIDPAGDTIADVDTTADLEAVRRRL